MPSSLELGEVPSDSDVIVNGLSEQRFANVTELISDGGQLLYLATVAAGAAGLQAIRVERVRCGR